MIRASLNPKARVIGTRPYMIYSYIITQAFVAQLAQLLKDSIKKKVCHASRKLRKIYLVALCC